MKKGLVEEWLNNDLKSDVGEVFNVSIDRLTIVGDWAKKGPYGFQKLLNRFDNEINIKRGDGTSEPSGFLFGDKCYFEIKNKKYVSTLPAFRVDFNPNKLTSVEILFLKDEILPLLALPSFTRIDFAFDISSDLSNCYFGNPFKKESRYINSGILETINLGSLNSSYHITIYNKKEEIKVKKSVEELSKNDLNAFYSPLGWWRVELKVKSEKAKINGNFSPFNEDELFKDGFKICRPSWASIDDVSERLIVKGLLEMPELLKEMSPHSRRKYKKIIAQNADYDYTDFLKNAYIENKERLVKECISYFKNSEKEIFVIGTAKEQEEILFNKIIKIKKKKRLKEDEVFARDEKKDY